MGEQNSVIRTERQKGNTNYFGIILCIAHIVKSIGLRINSKKHYAVFGVPDEAQYYSKSYSSLGLYLPII